MTRNIILLIGDGLSPGFIGLAQQFKQKISGQKLRMTEVLLEGTPAYLTTFNFDAMISDSASAATAIACGQKTRNGLLGLTPSGRRCESILEKSLKAGKQAGLVTTTSLTHATPAAFAAHTAHRENESEIAAQMLAQGIQVMMGGGAGYWLPAGAPDSLRADERDLLREAGERNYTLLSSASELRGLCPSAESYLLGLFNRRHMNYEIDRNPQVEPSLAEMTTSALNRLYQAPDGFFLMVEGGRIDHAAHENDLAALLHEILAFDEAVGCALDFQAEVNDTLVIITADHETAGLIHSSNYFGEQSPGGRQSHQSLSHLAQVTASFEAMLALPQQNHDPFLLQKVFYQHTGIPLDLLRAEMALSIEASNGSYYWEQNILGKSIEERTGIGFVCADHTANPVLLLAKGPGADRIHGVIDNIELFRVMCKAFGIDHIQTCPAPLPAQAAIFTTDMRSLSDQVYY